MGLKLEHIRVRDVMHYGILSCAGDTALREVAAIMARHRVHAVAVTTGPGTRPAGVVTDHDVVAALATATEPTAAQAAAAEPLSASSEERLDGAAHLLAAHGVSHLVVLDAADGHPIGVLSTLDLVAVYADHVDR